MKAAAKSILTVVSPVRSTHQNSILIGLNKCPFTAVHSCSIGLQKENELYCNEMIFSYAPSKK
uniref:Macaca fascicularis brain cDNA clone: QflA-21759, similar to human hypothetical protein FLJ38149 (FLJ38149), mRNA, RefSeq: XM_375563.1 n=1 Tax=Macaca fascicularis TaxID=9541 RepID=I7GIQ4_MACFA|nr:unnamed protein product [Macaca fascicularis]